MPLFEEELQELKEATAIHFDGSHSPNGTMDNFDIPFQAGPSQRLIDAKSQKSELNIQGTRSNPDRGPSPVPMSANGYEGQGDSLFTLTPSTKF